MNAGVPARSTASCHHEAGHALTRWFFGHSTFRIVVLSDDDIRAGRWIEDRRGRVLADAAGFVEGYGIHDPPFGPSPLADARIDRLRAIARDVELVNCYAGVLAEAAYRKRSIDLCFLYGGWDDQETAIEIADAWWPIEAERKANIALAYKRATALVRSRSGGAAIAEIAAALKPTGELTGAATADICRRAYGGRECSFGAWETHWPPTLDQIRAGFVPD